MIIETTPLGVLLGSAYNSKYDSKFSRVLNRFDNTLVYQAKGWDSHSPTRYEYFGQKSRPVLSSEVYYNHLLGMQEELTPEGMFDDPEKAQVYLDLIKYGAVGSTLEEICVFFHRDVRSLLNYKDACEMIGSPYFTVSKLIKEVIGDFKHVSPNLFHHAVDPHTLYLAVDPDPVTAEYYEGYHQKNGAINLSTVVSSLGEIYSKVEVHPKDYSKKEVYLYMSSLGKIKFFTRGKVSKVDLRSIINFIGHKRKWSHGSTPTTYKLILMSILYSIYRESGDLFDFVLSSSEEQQLSIVREGLSSGLNSKYIKPPQDGSLTDLIACIAERVTWEK